MYIRLNIKDLRIFIYLDTCGSCSITYQPPGRVFSFTFESIHKYSQNSTRKKFHMHPRHSAFFNKNNSLAPLQSVVRTVACVAQRDDPLLFFNKNHMLNKWESKSWSNISILPITDSLQLLLESICAYNSHNSTFEGLL